MNNNTKISIRFFDDREVRAVWDEENNKWWFSVLDIVAVLTGQYDYTKTRNYWKYLKAKLKKETSEVVSITTQLKLLAPDGKKRLTDMLDYNGIIALGKQFPGKKANRFIERFTFSDESIDGKSKTKAYALFESSLIDSIEVGTTKGLQQHPDRKNDNVAVLHNQVIDVCRGHVFSACHYRKNEKYHNEGHYHAILLHVDINRFFLLHLYSSFPLSAIMHFIIFS